MVATAAVMEAWLICSEIRLSEVAVAGRMEVGCWVAVTMAEVVVGEKV